MFENERDGGGYGPGVVSFITASSYLRGPGFAGMREKLRRTLDELWIIDLEGENLGARKTENVFNIQTPVAIAVGVRYGEPDPASPARVRHVRVDGTSEEKLAKLRGVSDFDDLDWRECFSGWQETFLPEGEGEYFSWPRLTEVFPWQQGGVKAGRTWPIASDKATLEERWKTLVSSERSERKPLFKDSSTGKQHSMNVSMNWLPVPASGLAISGLEEDAPQPALQRYAFRSFDLQWILADARLIDRSSPSLWRAHGDRQVYLTSLLTEVLGEGPTATATAEIPDLHHFRGSFGGKHVIPLWRDAAGTVPNVTGGVLGALSEACGEEVTAEDLFCYAYAVLYSPSYTERFWDQLTLPGPRLPITREAELFRRGAELGRELIRLHTYGERFADGKGGAPRGRARYEKSIPQTPEGYPESFRYSGSEKTLYVGEGEIKPVEAEVWDFSVSGLKVLDSWLGLRMREPRGKKSSPLDEIRPERWSGEMTEELMGLIWTLEASLALHPELADLLDRVTCSRLLSETDLPRPQKEETEPPE